VLRQISAIRHRSLLLAIGVGALGLRLFDLGAESIWIDEWSSVVLARSDLTHILRDRSQSVNPPLYFLLLHFWTQLFGDSELAIRMPSVVCGTIAVVLGFAVGRDLFSRFVGIITAALLAVSLFHIQHSQDARGYTLMVMLTLLSMLFFLRLIRSRGRAPEFGYVAASVMLLYTHAFGVLIVLAQNVFAAAVTVGSEGRTALTLRRWLVLQAVLVLLFIPWSVFLISQFMVIQSGYWIPEPALASLAETFLTYANDSPAILFCFAVLAGVAVINSVAGGGRAPLGTGDEPCLGSARACLLLLLWLGLPIVVPFVVSKISTPVYYTRYTLAASVAFLILVARGVESLPARYLRLVVVALLIVLSVAPIRGYYRATTKEPWRDVAAELDREATAGDLLLFNDGSYAELVREYYSSRRDLDLRSFNIGVILPTEQSPREGFRQVDELDGLLAGHERVWLILYKSNDTTGAIRERLLTVCQQVDHRRHQGIEMYLFARKS
jgi:mannosyltransferase